MSVVERELPRRRRLAFAAAGAVAVVVVAIVATRDTGRVDPPAAAPSTSTPPSTTSASTSGPPPNFSLVFTPSIRQLGRVAPIALPSGLDSASRIYLHRTGPANTVYVSAYIDVARGELRRFDDTTLVYGTVVGHVGDKLVLEGSARVALIDRDYAGVPIAVTGTDFVGVVQDLAVVAEYLSGHTDFRLYEANGRLVRTVTLGGPKPDNVGGVVGGTVVFEQAGRLLRIHLDDSRVEEFATGRLLGVGGNRVFYTACTVAGECTISEADESGVIRTTPIADYVLPGYDFVFGRVAPDGSGIVLLEPSGHGEVVLEHGTRLPLSVDGGPREYSWAPSGGRLFFVDGNSRQLDVIDYRSGRVTSIDLPEDLSVSLRTVAVW